MIYLIGGKRGEHAINTLQCYDMTAHNWTTLQPMKKKRSNHAVCVQGERIIVAGGVCGSNYLDSCEAFDTTSKRFASLRLYWSSARGLGKVVSSNGSSNLHLVG